MMLIAVSLCAVLGSLWLPSLASAQTSDPRIKLPYGIELAVPNEWTTSRSDLGRYVVRQGSSLIDASALPVDSSGHLILFGIRDGSGHEASIEISVLPTAVSQSTVATMSTADLSRAEADFRTEITGVLHRNGMTLRFWDGLERVALGGRHALVRRYRVSYSDGRPMVMESYGVFLGRKSIQVRLQYSESSPPILLQAIARIRRSVVIGASEL